MSVGPVNMRNRTSVAAFYNAEYSPPTTYDWVGDAAACDAGVVSLAWRQATIRRLNFFRRLCGLPLADLDRAKDDDCRVGTPPSRPARVTV